MSGWLTVDDMLLWCREVDNDDTRLVLSGIGKAVELGIERHLNRPVLANQAELNAMKPPLNNAVVVDPVIKQAALLMVSYLNENREAATAVSLEDMPYGYTYLLNDYRIRSNP